MRTKAVFVQLLIYLGFFIAGYFMASFTSFPSVTFRISQRNNTVSKPTPSVQGPTILCWITTMPENHAIKAVHVKNTWAKRCDRYLFVSSVYDPVLPAVAVVTKEGRLLLWNKTASALRYIWNKFGDKYDFVYKADDDTYALIDNLRTLLSQYQSSNPLLLGYNHKVFVDQGYPSGGAGYVLSRAALRKIINEFYSTPRCYNDDYSDAEDVKIGACAEALGIPMIDSRDRSGGAHFFYRSPFKELGGQKMSFLNWNIPVQDCCARNPVSFHYIEANEMYFLDYLLYTARNSEI